MAALILVFSALAISLYVWGLLRTAIWLSLGLLIPRGFMPVFAGILVSFFVAAAILIPYKSGAFDFRGLKRERGPLLFFLTGVLSGTLFYTVHPGLTLFVIGAFVTYGLLQAFRILRYPAQEVLVLPQASKWLGILSWSAAFLILAYSGGPTP